ncbi:MAG TPA: 30S ribosomal protein S6 [Desulfobacterales bacterium]
MKRYETVVIVDPDLSEDDRNVLIDRVKDLIEREKGLLVDIDEWGGRKLSYPINKKPRGHYYRLDYCGGGPLIHEMERSFRIDDRVMKFLTVLLEQQVDIEEIQAEIAKAAAERESAAAQAEAPTPQTEASDQKAADESETPTPTPAAGEAEAAAPAEPSAAQVTETPEPAAEETEVQSPETEAEKKEE